MMKPTHRLTAQNQEPLLQQALTGPPRNAVLARLRVGALGPESVVISAVGHRGERVSVAVVGDGFDGKVRLVSK